MKTIRIDDISHRCIVVDWLIRGLHSDFSLFSDRDISSQDLFGKQDYERSIRFLRLQR